MKKISLVIFGCEHRQNIVSNTYRSFKNHAKGRLDTEVLAWDGKLGGVELEVDYVLQSTKREGYLKNILKWIRFTNSDYFFWLEDDWSFNHDFSIDSMVETLISNDKLVQVRLSKRVLDPEEKKVEVAPGVFRSEPIHGVAFSTNPCICKTDPVKEGLSEIMRKGEDEEHHEEFMTRWLSEKGWICGVVDPGNEPSVEHEGYLERTDRSTHTVGMAREEKLPHRNRHVELENNIWEKISIIAKLFRKAASLSVRQLLDNRAHRLAKRICNVTYD